MTPQNEEGKLTDKPDNIGPENVEASKRLEQAAEGKLQDAPLNPDGTEKTPLAIEWRFRLQWWARKEGHAYHNWPKWKLDPVGEGTIWFMWRNFAIGATIIAETPKDD